MDVFRLLQPEFGSLEQVPQVSHTPRLHSAAASSCSTLLRHSRRMHTGLPRRLRKGSVGIAWLGPLRQCFPSYHGLCAASLPTSIQERQYPTPLQFLATSLPLVEQRQQQGFRKRPQGGAPASAPDAPISAAAAAAQAGGGAAAAAVVGLGEQQLQGLVQGQEEGQGGEVGGEAREGRAEAASKGVAAATGVENHNQSLPGKPWVMKQVAFLSYVVLWHVGATQVGLLHSLQPIMLVCRACPVQGVTASRGGCWMCATSLVLAVDLPPLATVQGSRRRRQTTQLWRKSQVLSFICLLAEAVR